MPSDPLEGGRCQPGYYCPGGSDAPINCTGGYYCATPGLAAPTGECNQGESFIAILTRLYFINTDADVGTDRN